MAYMNLKSHYKDVYSQNGEDGLISFLLKTLGITKGTVVEFGAWDGIHFSNTCALWKDRDFAAVLIEPDPVRFDKLLQNTKGRYTTNINKLVTTDGDGSLNEILAPHKDIVLLSIDIDGHDYEIWESFTVYSPPIVIIEVCTGFGSKKEVVSQSGTSFASMNKLARKKGYELVDHTGNCVYIRKDLVSKIFPGQIPSDEELFARTHFGSGINWVDPSHE